jgi:hypothetical protein
VRRLLQGVLNTSPAARRAFDAVDATIVVYVTRDSIFEALVRSKTWIFLLVLGVCECAAVLLLAPWQTRQYAHLFWQSLQG